ncbi:NAD(P) transhydrogenase subunit alpha [Candidatus Aerophobetes bacterium]|nr:NAD(P) transhydrogenase subunit alpha [Candidatus Aerophobetes bacterium]
MNLNNLTVGIPKEIMPGERRIAATPETVAKMVQKGMKVVLEHAAGEGSYLLDEDYLSVGARIEYDVQKLYSESHVILKVKEPQFNTIISKHEVDMMRSEQYLIAFLHPASLHNHDMVKRLASKGVISFTLDSVPRISRAQQMDGLTSMSTVAGYKGMLLAAELLPKFIPMVATAAGVIQPARALFIGTGVVGLQALATAKRLGAVVSASDIRSEALEQAKSLGAKIVELNIPQEIAVGEGGYARKLPEKWLLREREALRQAVSEADIVILSALVPGKIAPLIITEDMIKSMQPGSVVVDIAIDQGGNCEITTPGETSVKHGVTIIGIKNIPGTVPKSATGMLAWNIYHFLTNLVKDNSIVIDMNDEVVASCLLTRNGDIVHAGTREAMNL